MEQMALEAAGPHAVKDMISGKGVGLILKSLSISYRVSPLLVQGHLRKADRATFQRPVTYPDTVGHLFPPFQVRLHSSWH